ncbi:MAG: hypothetical protein LH606_02565 [Cytophagaceae bacterium]|nr:hypothetical protein [Cytophagaceae bacterium]
MRKILCICFLAAGYSAQAQLFTPTRIFASGVNLRAEVMPTAGLSDTARFGYARFNVQGIIPIRGGAGLKLHNFKLKKIDVEINQMFLAVNVGYRAPTFSFPNPEISPVKQPFYTASAALTGIHASLRDKIWLYAVGIGVSETDELLDRKTARPYGMGGAVRVRIAGLRTQWFYGGGVLFEPGKITPVPIAGVQTRLFTKNTRLTVILPVQVTLAQRLNKKTWGEIGVSAGGFNTGYQAAAFGPNAIRLAYRQWKGSVSLNVSPIKPVNLSVEAGVAAFRSLTVSRAGDQLREFTPAMSPFVAVSAYFNLSKSLLDSRGFGSLL